MSDVRVQALDASTAGAWLALFDRAASHCYCRWWHFAGTKNEWLARCAHEPEASRGEAERAIAAAESEALGLVAMSGALAIGWMKVAPRRALPKLRGLPVYRGLDLGADDGVWSIGCFLVDPEHRRRGVAAALLDAAPELVSARGGSCIEAYPRSVHETEGGALHDAEAMMGPEALFVSRGFARVEGDATKAYPVYRLAVSSRTP